MVRQTAARGTVQAFSTINTISARLVDANGGQALPGKGRDRSGVCGSAIRGAGLDMVSRLAAIRERLGLDYAIIGVGGVVAPEDYRAYRAVGADAVMSATGAMWDAELAARSRRMTDPLYQRIVLNSVCASTPHICEQNEHRLTRWNIGHMHTIMFVLPTTGLARFLLRTIRCDMVIGFRRISRARHMPYGKLMDVMSGWLGE